MNPHSTVRILISLVLLALATVPGCGPVKGYPGPTRPASALAAIRPSPPDTQIGAVVTAVDGLEVNAEISLEVLPGSRTLTLRLQPFSLQQMQQSGGAPIAAERERYNLEWQTSTTLEVTVEAGQIYEIVGRWSEPMYLVQVIQESDGTVVASTDAPAVRRSP